jgi:hypothetical protein
MGKAVKILAALGEGTKSIVLKTIFWYPILSLLHQSPVLLIPKSGTGRLDGLEKRVGLRPMG